MKKNNKKLSISFPEGFVSALDRRHNGRKLDIGKLAESIVNMKMMYSKWQEMIKKRDYLFDVYWEENDIEGHFGEPIFYGAHRRLRNIEKKIEDLHRDMFYLLLNCDGNYEQFDSGSLSVQEIYDDFSHKYIKNKDE